MERSIVSIQQPTMVKLPTPAEQEPPANQDVPAGQEPPTGKEPPTGQELPTGPSVPDGQEPPTGQPTKPAQEPPKRAARNIFAGLGYFGIYLLVQVVVGVGYAIKIVVRMLVMSLLNKQPFDLSGYVSQIMQAAVNMTFVVNVLFLLILWLIFAVRKKKIEYNEVRKSE